MTNFVFKINGTDYSDCVNKYSYKTSYTPVKSSTVTTMDGIDHYSIVRYKGGLSLTINANELSRYKELCSALTASPLEITYHSMQRNADVTETMKIEGIESGTALKDDSRSVVDSMDISFTQV